MTISIMTRDTCDRIATYNNGCPHHWKKNFLKCVYTCTMCEKEVTYQEVASDLALQRVENL